MTLYIHWLSKVIRNYETNLKQPYGIISMSMTSHNYRSQSIFNMSRDVTITTTFLIKFPSSNNVILVNYKNSLSLN